jgi:hypothetical protein
MTSELTSEVAAVLLLILLGSVLAMAIFFAVSYSRYVQSVSSLRQRRKENEFIAGDSDSFPAIFENPLRWIAIKSANVTAVQAALGLHHPSQCSWAEGMSKLSENNLFISPPVQGWILLIGQGLPDPSEDIDRCYRLIVRLSRSLGHVQFFSANRAVNHHAWAQVDDGRVRRGYAWAGETLWNQGAKSQAENDLGVVCFDYGESAEALALSSANGDSYHTNADKLFFLAARWSLDPTAITGGMVPKSPGVIGDLCHPKGRR